MASGGSVQRRTGAGPPNLAAGGATTGVLVIGHAATRWAFDHFVNGVPLEDLADEDFVWRPGWDYHLGS